MSIMKPKDGDYIARGLLLLFCWTCVGWVPFAVLGGIAAGPGGAVVGIIFGVFFGPVVLYPAYLKRDPKVAPKK